MLTNTIAEIRTYGEGFIIVDQSPSSVDIAAIKNTNTKIVLRTPEANDREAVGRSIGLTKDQVEEIAKLPSGVAVVYQNNWINPVLAMIDKANVQEEPYVPKKVEKISTARASRSIIVRMMMQPWFGGTPIKEEILISSLKVIDLSKSNRKRISQLTDDYNMFGGHLIWQEEQLPELQKLLKAVLGINDNALCSMESPSELRLLVANKVSGLSTKNIEDICYILTEEAH